MQSSISFMKNLFLKRAEKFLESRSLRPDVFAILPTGSGRPSFFLLFPRIISVIKGKVGESVFHNHHRCASRSHNETKLKRFGITATTAIAWGQAWSKTRDCERKVSVWDHSWKPRKAKKILFERVFNALTEVKEKSVL